MSDKIDLIKYLVPKWKGPEQTPHNLTATEVDRLTSTYMNELLEQMRPGMNKRHYVQFAEAITQIEQGIIDLHIPMPSHYREQIMELVTARIALVCAKDNNNFDSFQFKAAARPENARRGIDAKTGSAPRSSKRVTK